MVKSETIDNFCFKKRIISHQLIDDNQNFQKTTDVPFTSIYIDNNLYSANNSYCILPSHSILDKISFISITCPLDQTYCFRFCKPVNR